MDYHAALRTLKDSFRGGGEGAFYRRVMAELGRPEIDWLDVGVGDGTHAVQHVIDHFERRGQRLRLLGVDPGVEPGVITTPLGTRVDMVRCRFEHFPLDETFDVANADQSLYYFDDLDAQLGRIVGALRHGGKLLAVCWSCEDVLYKIRQRLRPSLPDCLTGEALLGRLRDVPELRDVRPVLARTEIDLASWRRSPDRLRAALQIVARRAVDEDDLAALSASLTDVLSDFGDRGQRVNMALAATKVSSG